MHVRADQPEPLTADKLLYAYSVGVFPMADPRGQIVWFSPDPRCIFEIDGLRLSRSLRQRIRRKEYEIRLNTRFSDVVRACTQRGEGTWISPELADVYAELHQHGYAHSVEAWQGDEMVGGLYGVTLGAAFFGESMFHRATDASKVALAALFERLRTRGFTLLDAQWITPHLASLGAIEIPRAAYLTRLSAAIRRPCKFV